MTKYILGHLINKGVYFSLEIGHPGRPFLGKVQ